MQCISQLSLKNTLEKRNEKTVIAAGTMEVLKFCTHKKK